MKKKATINIDAEAHNTMKELGLNVSDTINNYLYERLDEHYQEELDSLKEFFKECVFCKKEIVDSDFLVMEAPTRFRDCKIILGKIFIPEEEWVTSVCNDCALLPFSEIKPLFSKDSEKHPEDDLPFITCIEKMNEIVNKDGFGVWLTPFEEFQKDMLEIKIKTKAKKKNKVKNEEVCDEIEENT